MAYFARRFLLDNTNPISNNSVPEAVVPEPHQQEESDFAVILAALICALICVVGLLAVARCTWLRHGDGGFSHGGSSSGGPSHQSANKGLKKKVLDTLPIYTYDLNKAKAKAVVFGKADEVMEAEDCAICLTEYVDGDEIRELPNCGHVFHVQCIDMWLGSHSSCPSCRQVLAVRCRKCGEFDSAVDGGGGGGFKLTNGKPVSLGASTSSTTYLP